MGQANSTVITSTDIINSINDITVKNIQTCSGDFNFTQNFVVSGNGNVIQNILLDQSSNVNFSCFGSTTNQVKLINDLANSISQKANSNAQFLLGFAFNSAVTTSDSVLSVLTSTMVSNIQKCNISGNINQNFDVNGSYNQILDVTMSQNPNFFCKCVFGSDNVTDVSNKLSSDINQQADAQSSMGNWITLIIIVALIILALVAVGYFTKLMKNQQGQAKDMGKELPTFLSALGIKTQTSSKAKTSDKPSETSENESTKSFTSTPESKKQ